MRRRRPRRCSPSAGRHWTTRTRFRAYAQELRDFLDESEPTERRAFIQSFVKETVLMPGDALLRYAVPMPDDSRVPARIAEGMALDASMLFTRQ